MFISCFYLHCIFFLLITSVTLILFLNRSQKILNMILNLNTFINFVCLHFLFAIVFWSDTLSTWRLKTIYTAVACWFKKIVDSKQTWNLYNPHLYPFPKCLLSSDNHFMLTLVVGCSWKNLHHSSIIMTASWPRVPSRWIHRLSHFHLTSIFVSCWYLLMNCCRPWTHNWN